MTTNDQIIREVGALREDVGALRVELVAISQEQLRTRADLDQLLARENRASIRAELLAEMGMDDLPTDHGLRPIPPLPPPPPATDERTPPMDKLASKVAENYKWTVGAVLLALSIAFGAVPQVFAALQALGYLPAAPVAAEVPAPEPLTPVDGGPLP